MVVAIAVMTAIGSFSLVAVVTVAHLVVVGLHSFRVGFRLSPLFLGHEALAKALFLFLSLKTVSQASLFVSDNLGAAGIAWFGVFHHGRLQSVFFCVGLVLLYSEQRTGGQTPKRASVLTTATQNREKYQRSVLHPCNNKTNQLQPK